MPDTPDNTNNGLKDRDSNTAIRNCSQHKKPLDVYCETCVKLICLGCATCTNSHQRHNCDQFVTACDKKFDIVNNRIDEVSKAKDAISRRRTEIQAQGEYTVSEICELVSEVKSTLDKIGDKLAAEVEMVVKDKSCILDCQVQEADALLTELDNCKCLIDQCRVTRSKGFEELEGEKVMKRVKKVIETCRGKEFQPLEEADVKLVRSNSKINEISDTLGTINYSLQKVNITLIPDTQTRYVNERSVITFSFCFSDGSSLSIPLSNFTCYLSHPKYSTPLHCTVHQVPQSQLKYCIAFTPQARGIYRFHIAVNSSILQCHPANIGVTIPPKILCDPFQKFTGLKEPGGITVADDGRVIITEFHGHRINIFGQDGGKISSFGTEGTQKGKLSGPQGVAVTSRGTIVVCDFHNHRIQEFTIKGECVSCVGTKGSGKLRFVNPLGIAIDKKTGNVFVADRKNNRVQVLNPDLSFCRTFGSGGKGNGQFNLIHDLAFDDQRFLYCTDMNNHRIHKFTPGGQFIHTITGKFKYPGGLSIFNNLLYISEGCGTNRMSIVTTSGDCVHRFGSSSFRRTAFDNHGFLYVCVDDGVDVY